MTDPENGPNTTGEPAPDDHAGEGGSGGENGSQGRETPNQEAARYRTKLRETEGERDGLRERLNGYLTAEAERLASTDDGASLYDGADMWRHGVTLDDVLDEDGKVSANKVREKIESVTDGRDHLRRDKGPRTPRPDRSQASGGNGHSVGASPIDALAQMLKTGHAGAETL